MEQEGVQAAEFLASGVYGDVHTFVGDEALEERFKQMTRPRLVMLITHGFFLADQTNSGLQNVSGADVRSAFAKGLGLERLKAQENPLYRSGIVLAGANTIDESLPEEIAVDDGWITAEEISQMDLRGTDLVVLSACDTGRGAVRIGDAVAGLRSAFLFAGAQTIVGSLHEVPDRETGELMKRFFANLSEGQGKLESLNAARLALISELREQHGAAHPFLWASFVLVGAS